MKRSNNKIICKVVLMFLISMIMLFTMSCSLFKPKESYEIASISSKTDPLSDDLENSITEYITNKQISYHNYEVVQNDTDDMADIMMQAILNGAKIIICEGQQFDAPVRKIQNLFPAISFVLFDAVPLPGENSDPTVLIPANVTYIDFNDEESGYIAGYSSVFTGLKHLAFICDADYIRNDFYKYGFLSGADDAALLLGISENVSVLCSDDKADSTNISRITNTICDHDTEMIFTVGNYSKEVCKISSSRKIHTITSLTNNTSSSNTVLYVGRNYNSAIEVLLNSYYDNNAKLNERFSGRFVTLGVEDNAIVAVNNSNELQIHSSIGNTIIRSCIDNIKNGNITIKLDDSIFDDLHIKAEVLE